MFAAGLTADIVKVHGKVKDLSNCGKYILTMLVHQYQACETRGVRNMKK